MIFLIVLFLVKQILSPPFLSALTSLFQTLLSCVSRGLCIPVYGACCFEALPWCFLFHCKPHDEVDSSLSGFSMLTFKAFPELAWWHLLPSAPALSFLLLQATWACHWLSSSPFLPSSIVPCLCDSSARDSFFAIPESMVLDPKRFLKKFTAINLSCCCVPVETSAASCDSVEKCTS